MQKSKTWSCSEGCVLTYSPCPHLEALLPALKPEYLGEIDKIALMASIGPEQEFYTFCLNNDISPSTINALGLKFIEDKSWDEISEVESWVSKQVLLNTYTKLMARLKDELSK